MISLRKPAFVATLGHPLNFFGNGSDGALSTSGNVSLTSTEDGPIVVKNYTDLTINAGHTLTVASRCKGLLIYATGNVLVNGTISMSQKGAYAVTSATAHSYNYYTGGRLIDYRVGVTGAAGGNGAQAARVVRAPNNGDNGTKTIGSNYVEITTGGGGSGAGLDQAGSGSAGSSFSGGSGGGATFGSGCDANIDAFINGQANGGYGGRGNTNYPTGSLGAGAGAGNPGGPEGLSSCFTGGPSGFAPAGTGGILVIIARGNVTIGSTGVLSAVGQTGGAYRGAGDGGGGSGGGCIWILTAGAWSAIGGSSFPVNGGAGGAGKTGSGYVNGGVGGSGYPQAVGVDP
jgi:hypothetical protein